MNRGLFSNQLVLLCTLGFFCFLGSANGDYHIAADGSDTNPGTKEKPFAGLEAARDAIRELKEGGALPDGGVTVWIHGGDYYRTKTFELNEQDAGTKEAPIVYRAWQDEEVRLVGGAAIPAGAFKPVTDTAVLERLVPESRKRVLQADLKALGITNYGTHHQYGHAQSVCPAPLELFFNDGAMPLARYPNKGFVTIGKVIDPGSVPRIKDYKNIRGGTFEYTDGRHARWAGLDDVWLQGTFMYGFADDKIKVESIDPETRRVKLATPHMYGVGGGRAYRHYVARNILEELDSPGEWYVDRKTGVLYFWPPATLEEARIAVSILEDPVIALEGVSYVTLRGLTVEVARGIGIYIERGQNNLIAGCTVRNIGTSGIFMGQGARQTFPHITHDDYEGVPVSRRVGNLQGHIYKYTAWDRKSGKNHGIVGCDVYNTGCGGIYLSGGSKKNLIPGNCYALNCKVHDYNRRNQFLWSGINIDGCGNRIAHCEIFNSDFQGIYVHGNDHIYEYNNIHHVTRNSDDTSPWYMGRDPSDRGNIVRYNFFHHIGRPDRLNMGVYCDDGTCGVTAHGNVFHKMDTRYGMLYSNGGHDLTFTNNIIVDPGGPAVMLKSHFYTWARDQNVEYFGKNGICRRRLTEQVDIHSPPYSTRYPELADHLDVIVEGKEWVGMRPRRNLMARNVIVRGKGKLQLSGAHAQFEERDNFETEEDPGFVDAENMNFQLRNDSIVYRKIPGFERIPFDKIGLYVDEYRRKQ